MGPDLARAIHEISFRMRLLRARQENTGPQNLTERDIMLLELIEGHGEMTVSQIAASYPGVSESTISTGITKLWRDELVSKTINPENQRITIVALTGEGEKALAVVKGQRVERFKTLFQAIETTDDEKKVFMRVLTRAIAYFDEILGLDKPVSKGAKGERPESASK